VKPHNYAEIQGRINESDIVHLKGDWPPGDGYMGFLIMHKPVIVSVSGGYFRKKKDLGLEKFKPKHYVGAFTTAFTPDLCYPEYSNLWTPHPIDSDDQSIDWQRSEPPLFIHSRVSTGRSLKKGTDFIMEVFDKISKTRQIETRVLTGLTFKEVVEQRKAATIFFDQFGVGFYGNSAVEAMQYGIPTCAWISPSAFEQARGSLAGCPVISMLNKNVDLWAEKIIKILDSDMDKLSRDTKVWCDRVHGYKAIALQWDGIYKGIA